MKRFLDSLLSRWYVPAERYAEAVSPRIPLRDQTIIVGDETAMVALFEMLERHQARYPVIGTPCS